MSELELLIDLQNGNTEALSELYNRLAKNIYSLAFQILKNKEDAEEVLQDCFIKLNENVARFNPKIAGPRAYIYTIARNQALMRIRKRQSRPVKADTAFEDFSFISSDKNLDDKIVLQAALDRLEPAEAELLKAAFFLGYSHGEISKMKNIPLGTVKAKIRRSLIKLKDYLGEQ